MDDVSLAPSPSLERELWTGVDEVRHGAAGTAASCFVVAVVVVGLGQVRVEHAHDEAVAVPCRDWASPSPRFPNDIVPDLLGTWDEEQHSLMASHSTVQHCLLDHARAARLAV